MSCIIKARVRLDLKKHWRYIARDNVDAADRLLAAAELTFDFIATHPELRLAAQLSQTRRRPLPGD